MHATSITHAVSLLDQIIEECRRSNNQIGYFAALYRRVTQHVAAGIAVGRFEDGKRMELLDVVFANRFLRAYEQRQQGSWISRSWARTFDVAALSQPLIIQHLLLGMNAHINLDLGVAAAEVSTSSTIDSLRSDFNAINVLLSELVEDVQQRLNTLSPLMAIIDTIAGRHDETIGNFSMERARDEAWKNACTLVAVPQGQERFNAIHAIDDRAVLFSHVLYDRHMDLLLTPARLVESHNVVHCIDVLAA